MQTQEGSTLESARTVSTYLLKEPVKEAVREALREEAADVEPVESADVDGSNVDADSREAEGGRSIGSVAVVLVTVGGLAYLARRRMRSGDEGAPGEPEDFERSSHGSTGEVGSSTATVSDES